MTLSEIFEPLNRELFLRALHLDRFSYYFFEAYDQQLLRALKVNAGNLEPLLEPWALSDEEALNLSSPEFPVFLTRHPGYRLSVQPVDSNAALLGEVLPYPLSQIVANVSESGTFPSVLRSSLERFIKAFSEVERSLVSEEFGCLTFCSSLEKIHLVMHHVGRKRIRLTTLSESHAENLEALFNGRCVRLQLAVELQATLLDQFDHLASQVQGLLRTPNTSPLPGVSAKPPELTL